MIKVMAYACRPIWIGFVLCCYSVTANADFLDGFSGFFGLSAVLDNNVNTAEKSDIRREDILNTANMQVNLAKNISHKVFVTLHGKVAYTDFRHFNELSEYEYETKLALHFARSLGPFSNRYQLFVRVVEDDVFSDRRDSTTYIYGMQMLSPLSLRTSFFAGIDYRQREAKGETFDTINTGLFTNFDFQLSNNFLLYTNYRFLTGDTTSSGIAPLNVINNARAIEPDEVFGGSQENQFAYRLKGDTHVFSLGGVMAFHNNKRSLDLSARTVQVRADGGNRYERLLYRMTFTSIF